MKQKVKQKNRCASHDEQRQCASKFQTKKKVNAFYLVPGSKFQVPSVQEVQGVHGVQGFQLPSLEGGAGGRLFNLYIITIFIFSTFCNLLINLFKVDSELITLPFILFSPTNMHPCVSLGSLPACMRMP